MEFEQVAKRLEWLDEQQRKNKTDLGDLTVQLTSLETSLNALAQQNKSLSQELTDLGNLAGRLNSLEASISALTQQLRTVRKEFADLSPAAARMNQFDEMMTKQRADLGKMIEAMEKSAIRREQEGAKLHHAELEEIRKSIFQLSNSVNAEEINKRFKDRAHEEQRLTLAVQDMRSGVDAVVGQSKEILQAQKAMEEVRRQDAKRLADLQGELAAVRKRADDAREKTTLHSDAIRSIENRINELFETENSRQEGQASFLAQQAMAQVERGRAWKDWQEKYEVFRQQAENMEAQITALDDSIRSAKRAQEAYDDLNQKLERRIAEVGEMQRLAEDRIRQEWVAFKGDEQKRWTAHSLSQEQSVRDLHKSTDKMEQRVTTLEDTAQTIQDQLHQTTDTTEKQLQELMNVAHEWLSAYERIMGHAKTKARKTSR